MQAFYAALLLALLPAQLPRELVRVDWSHVVPADAEISALRTEYAAAVNASDARRAMALYTPDALTIHCDGSLVRGAVAVGARIEDRTQEHAAVTLMPRRFSSAGMVASETGTFTESVAGASGPTSVEGVYVTIYSRLPGGPWRIALEVRTTGHTPALAVW
jgi:ketosteroid isomerase-like protein